MTNSYLSSILNSEIKERLKDMKDIKDIYEEVVRLGLEHGNHESDLLVKVTPESKKLVDAYEFKCNVKMFSSQIDGSTWFDIPFAYTPVWEKRAQIYENVRKNGFRK